MFISTADVTDRNGAITMIGYAAPNLFRCLNVLVDGGYTGDFRKQRKNTDRC